MKFIGPLFESRQNWRGLFGLSREDIYTSVLQGGWLRHPQPESVLAVEEISGKPFTLAFNGYADEAGLQRHRAAYGPALYSEGNRDMIVTDIQFEISLAYRDDPAQIRLRDVYFRNACAHRKMGNALLFNLAATALAIGADKIFVHPGLEGSYFWPSRGAIIQEGDIAFRNLAAHAEAISRAASGLEQGWSAADLAEFRRVFAERDVMGLHRIISRDDLLLNGAPCRYMLMKNFALGFCLFDFDHPWTQKCLRERIGFDVTAQRARRARPAPQPQALKTSAPAF